MGSQKSMWRRVMVCVIVSIFWISGCINNKSNAPITRVGNTNNNVVQDIFQLDLSRDVVVDNHKQKQLNSPSQWKTIYNRSYSNIQKGSYSGTIYRVKSGDTLFYIAWITGKDYLDLAQRNKISEPFNLNIGQILQVSNEKKLINNNMPSEKILVVSKSNHSNVDTVISKFPTKETNLTKLSTNSSTKKSYQKNLNKHNIRKNMSLLKNKVLPIKSTTINNTVPVKLTRIPIIGWLWPTDGKIINGFSTEEGGNKGVDISGFRGQPVLATAGGKVVYAGNALQGYGNLIIIKHSDDYLSAYAHNDTILVHEQQDVKAGQKIATMGSTGTNTTRLHFEIRYKGKSVNPLHYLQQR